MKILLLISLLINTGCTDEPDRKDHEKKGAQKQDTVLNGWVRTYFPTGGINSEIYYTNGKKDSIGRYYWKGKVTSISKYQNDTLLEQIDYNPDGSKNSVTHFRNSGNDTMWYESGILKYANVRGDGKESAKRYFQNGTLHQSEQFNHTYGNPMIRTGVWSYFTEDGVLYKKEQYENDSLIKIYVGTLKKDHPPIETKIIADKSRVFNGWLRELVNRAAGVDPSELVDETHYRNGRKEGWSIHYNNSEYAIESICYYHEGIIEGPYYSYYSDNQPEEKGQYKNGEKTGEWLKYDKDGNVISREVFKQN